VFAGAATALVAWSAARAHDGWTALPAAVPAALVPAALFPAMLPLAVPVLAMAAAWWSWRVAVPAEVHVAEHVVLVAPRGINRLWAWSGPVRLARHSVVGARVADDLVPPGIRVAGTWIPGVVAMGRFRAPMSARQELWLTTRRAPAVVLDLVGDARYARVVCQVRDPDAVVSAVGRAA